MGLTKEKTIGGNSWICLVIYECYHAKNIIVIPECCKVFYIKKLGIPAKKGKKKKKPRKSVSLRPFSFTSNTSNVPIAIALSVSLFLAEIILRRVSQQDFVYHGSYQRLVRGSWVTGGQDLIMNKDRWFGQLYGFPIHKSYIPN